MTLLDFIRYEQELRGTKIGCREGDCGACTVLIGERMNDKLRYSSATSCLVPLANAQGKHIVTIEGINVDGLNLVQEAFVSQGATQCGFCTPGFIVSLTGFCLNDTINGYTQAIDAVNGNICRCTGYKSIERAAMIIHEKMQERKEADAIGFAIGQHIIPGYFNGIAQRLKNIPDQERQSNPSAKKMGGGTDLYVQQHDSIAHEELEFLYDKNHLKGIYVNGNTCEIGASTVVSDLEASPVFRKHFRNLDKYIKLVSSTPIRNMATVAGNFTNASPIGDLTIFFLALDAKLLLAEGDDKRWLPLREFYKRYKELNKGETEIIEKISFELPGPGDLFNFEKVCKRTYLDIASVNTALSLKMENGMILEAGLSAGGVGPVPAFLAKSSAFLNGKKISEGLIKELIPIAQSEISPISDARGTHSYKRLLLGQLIKAHFIELCPSLQVPKLLHA